jgi:Ser/Thr protein kinase RdoA (MazF antagonist)
MYSQGHASRRETNDKVKFGPALQEEWALNRILDERFVILNAYDDGHSPRSGPGKPGDEMSGSIDAASGSELGAAYFQEASAKLAVKADDVDPQVLIDALARHYGVSASVTALSSEVEHTAAATLSDGRQFILKTSAKPEALESFRFQSSVLDSLETATGFVAPGVLRTVDGSLMFEAPGMCGYVQERLSGCSLRDVGSSPDVLSSAGRALGELDRALELCEVPGSRRPVLWNVSCWPRLGEFARYLPGGPVADLVGAAMREFSERIEPHLPDLAWQVTHNDPSPHNSFVMDRGIGFIDFGDGGWNPRIQDLAIASGHHVTDPEQSLGGAEHVIAGYAGVCPLTDLEASLLVGLIKARQSALILINYWRAELFPDEAEYIKKNVGRAEKGLTILSSLSSSKAEEVVRVAASETSGATVG